MFSFFRLAVVFLLSMSLASAALAEYDFGDHKSSTLVSKAWNALSKSDVEAVLAYTNKCIELYAEKAKEMQAELKVYPAGDSSEIFSYWALNDVATAYFIQGEAFRKSKVLDKAKEAYQAVIKDYKFGQCWDPGGWFWKPAEAAQEKIAKIDGGTDELDFSDNSSSALAAKAWAALRDNDLESVVQYVNKCLELYEPQAKEMQASLKNYAWESKDKVFSYWALNDVGTCLYIQGKAFEDAGKPKEAKETYARLVNEFKFAQCWDPGGWFWKPAEDAEKRLKTLE